VVRGKWGGGRNKAFAVPEKSRESLQGAGDSRLLAIDEDAVMAIEDGGGLRRKSDDGEGGGGGGGRELTGGEI
jgi:hypothetical protein